MKMILFLVTLWWGAVAVAGESRSFPLGEGKYLLETLEDQSAYNVEKSYVLEDRSQKTCERRALTFPSYDVPCCDVDAAEVERFLKATPRVVTRKSVGARQFDPKTRELTVLSKGRGMGDCGSYARYAFPGGEPTLVDFRMKLNCDGRFPYPVTESDLSHAPEGWTVYPKASESP